MQKLRFKALAAHKIPGFCSKLLSISSFRPDADSGHVPPLPLEKRPVALRHGQSLTFLLQYSQFWLRKISGKCVFKSSCQPSASDGPACDRCLPYQCELQSSATHQIPSERRDLMLIQTRLHLYMPGASASGRQCCEQPVPVITSIAAKLFS